MVEAQQEGIVAPAKGRRSACGRHGPARRPSAHIQLFHRHRGASDPKRPFPEGGKVLHHGTNPPAWRSLGGKHMQIRPTVLTSPLHCDGEGEASEEIEARVSGRR
jgi:hypothetical protein